VQLGPTPHGSYFGNSVFSPTPNSSHILDTVWLGPTPHSLHILDAVQLGPTPYTSHILGTVKLGPTPHGVGILNMFNKASLPIADIWGSLVGSHSQWVTFRTCSYAPPSEALIFGTVYLGPHIWDALY
jgi:hypothetical protein